MRHCSSAHSFEGAYQKATLAAVAAVAGWGGGSGSGGGGRVHASICAEYRTHAVEAIEGGRVCFILLHAEGTSTLWFGAGLAVPNAAMQDAPPMVGQPRTLSGWLIMVGCGAVA